MGLPVDRLANVEDVAQWARTTVPALYAQRQRGEAPGALAVKIGRRLLWRPEDLEAWLERQAAGSRGVA